MFSRGVFLKLKTMTLLTINPIIAGIVSFILLVIVYVRMMRNASEHRYRNDKLHEDMLNKNPQFETRIKQIRGEWKVQFTHGVQTFTLDFTGGNYNDCQWLKDRLDECFNDAYLQLQKP
jgi:hypothetical protein